MNKWLLMAASTMMAFNASASTETNAGLCGYKDYFHLSNASHPGIYIVNGYSESELFLTLVGPRSFTIRDGRDCSSGYAHVTVAYDIANWCVLDIKDGPFMNHPTVRASCN
ncbi:hypothetical protein, partial [uncultured Legionella sp.]|uniref:hypothetical protein n=1 Tax=uncultured Legionella sp. TaxID=210934 RepID=UPI00260EF7F3